MTEPHPLMAMLLAQNSFVGEGIEVEAEIKPLPAQLEFGIGDAAVLASARTPLERDFAILKAIDPAEHAEMFPDWEERMLGLNNQGQGSFVLCEHFSAEDPEVSLGWFSRVKIMPISTERYEEAHRWITDGFPTDVPDWVHEYYQDYTDALSERAPERVPHTAVCPQCQGRNVDLVVSRRLVYKGRAGQLTKDDHERFITLVEPEVDDSHVAILECTDCHSTATLTDDEWELPGISS